MRRLWQRFTRWRHGRGFGVHSPLAYDLLTNVLNGPEGYYGDAYIEELFDRTADRRRGRSLLRVITKFRPVTVAYGSGVGHEWKEVVRRADSRIKGLGIETRADMYIVTEQEFEPPAGHVCVTVYLGRHTGSYRRDDAATAIDERLGPVVVDNGVDMSVAVRRRGLTAKTVYAKY